MSAIDPLSSRFYADELAVGQRFSSQTIKVDLEKMTGFASEFDPQPFHLDPEAAKESIFGGLAASGWFTAAVTMRLLVEGGLPIAGGIVATSIELNWQRPTRPGDELHVETEIIEIIHSKSKPNRVSLTTLSETLNQNGDVVQSTKAKLVSTTRS